ncbi:MAG: ABC transporter permease, partial [Lachnospiraceae bacterium]|nr:ABC transporter permease [Lachnospiraceae bacterium]
KYELKKMFSRKINRILLIAALLAAVALSVFAVGSARYVDENGEAHTGFMAARRLSADRNRWAGELTGDKIAQVVGSRQEINSKYSYQVPNEEYGKTIQSYSDIENFVIGVLSPDTDWDESVLYRLEDGQARELYSIYEGNLQEMAQEYGATPEQQHFLAEQYEKTDLPLTYAAKESWDTIEMYVETYAIILAIVIGFLAAGIFAEEFRSRSDAVFFSAKYGRTKATKNKVLAGMLAATVVYFAGMGIMLVLSLGVMGLSGFSTPYQIDQPYSIYAMTYGQYFLLTVLCGYIASLLAASVTMLIAARMRSASVAVCVPFLLFCVMPFIGRALSAFLTFFKLTPDMLVNVIECAKSPNVFQIGNLVFRQIPC